MKPGFVKRIGLLLIGGMVPFFSLLADDGVNVALQKFDRQFDDFYPWLAKLYDSKSGGFYFCLSARVPQKGRTFGPDIQSTNFGIGMLPDAGLEAKMPEPFRAKAISYFQSRQNPETGYFIDPDYPEMKDNERAMGRAVLMATSSLKGLKSNPLYQLPGEKNVNQADTKRKRPASQDASAMPNIPSFLATEEALAKWLDARPWGFSWTALDEIASQATIISQLAPDLMEARTRQIMDYVTRKQDKETGFIGGGSTIVQISGAFKLTLFCDKLQVSVPQAELMRASVLRWYRESDEEIEHACFIRNPVELLYELNKRVGKDLTREELMYVIDFSTKKLKTLKCPDGGFSLRLNKYYIMPNDLFWEKYPVGRQGDLNAAANAKALRKSLYRLAKASPPLLKAPENFWQECEKN